MDIPVTVSSLGVSVDTAQGVEQLFNNNPFHKIDSTVPTSLQEVNIFLSTEPPNPNGSSVTYQRNLVYQFKHGYDYVPSAWFYLLGNSMEPTLIGMEGTVIYVYGAIYPGSAATFMVNIDEENVYYYIDKYWTSSTLYPAPNIVGTTLTIRNYIFVDDLSGNS